MPLKHVNCVVQIIWNQKTLIGVVGLIKVNFQVKYGGVVERQIKKLKVVNLKSIELVQKLMKKKR